MTFSNGFIRPLSLGIFVVVISLLHRNDALAPQYDFEPVAPDFLSAPAGQSCEKIDKDSLCGGQPYTMTTFPNLLQQDAAEAKEKMDGYRLLLQNNCSEHLHFFLCSVHMPMCTVVASAEVVVVPPCRPLCTLVQQQCESILNMFKYTWPEELACHQFPEHNGHNGMLCMPGSVPEAEIEPSTTSSPVPVSTIIQENRDVSTECNEGLVFINSSGTCALSCYSNLATSDSDKRFAEMFHMFLAGFTCLFALVAMFLHCCNSSRLTEAEKPVLCIIFCFVMMAVGYIVRVVGGREMGCGAEGGLVSNDLQNTGCVVVFFILYYFGLAGQCWWLILAITWFQEIIQKREKKIVQRSLRRAYCLGWIVPLFPTISIIVAKLVDSDQLMAVCYVGQQNAWNLLFFVLIPLIAVATVGSALLLVAFIRQQDTTTHSKPISVSTKIKSDMDGDTHYLGACVATYLPSTLIVIGCYFYDFATKDEHFGKPAIAVYGFRVFFQFIYGLVACGWLGWNSRCATLKLQKMEGYYSANLNKPTMKTQDGFSAYRADSSGAPSSSGPGHHYSSVGPQSPVTYQTSLSRGTFLKQQYGITKPSFSSDSNPETFV